MKSTEQTNIPALRRRIMFDSRTAGLPLNSDWMKDAMDMMSSGCSVDAWPRGYVIGRRARRGVECRPLSGWGHESFESAFDAAARLGSARRDEGDERPSRFEGNRRVVRAERLSSAHT